MAGIMLVMLTSSVTNRLRFITDLVLKEMLGLDFRLTGSPEEFIGHPGPKICYAREPTGDGLFIAAAALLFESGITRQDLNISAADGVPVLFETGTQASAIRFDLFAAAFYMVSRYEEYLPFTPDGFGRFPAEESIAWKEKFLGIPVVHLWAEMLAKLLKERYPSLEFRHRQYTYQPTIDIDHAWCYRGRTVIRSLGGAGRSLVRGRLPEISERYRVLTGRMRDPYDNYEYIRMVHEQLSVPPFFFVLFADHGRHDNNVKVTSNDFHKLLHEIDQGGRVGIHPSLASANDPEKFGNEYTGLCSVLGRKVTISRQHFLRISMPGTYRRLIQAGMTDDFSMGYPSHTGFRAGMAIPFRFFDLPGEETTSLVIHPISLMDVTMKDYLRLSMVESLDKIKNIIRTVRAVNGEFVSLWHNESLGDTGRWAGWRAVYGEMVNLAST